MPSAVVDADSFDRLRAAIPPERLAHILDLFHSTGEVHVARIVQGREVGDLEAIRFAAHTLKSSAAIVGARRLSQDLARLEAKAEARILPAASEVVAVQRRFTDAVQELLSR